MTNTTRPTDTVLGVLHGLLWTLAALPAICTAFTLPMLPDAFPTHFGLGGVDHWGGKYYSLLLPAFALLYAVCWRLVEVAVARQADRPRDDAPSWEVDLVSPSPRGTSRVFVAGGVWVLLIINALQAYSTYIAFMRTTDLDPVDVGIDQVTAVIAGLAMLFLGNVMPQVQPNHITGIRVPGAYAGPEAWRRCQRAGGVMFIVGGAIMATCGCLLRGLDLAAASIAIYLVLLLAMLAYGRYAGRRFGDVAGSVDAAEDHAVRQPERKRHNP